MIVYNGTGKKICMKRNTKDKKPSIQTLGNVRFNTASTTFFSE